MSLVERIKTPPIRAHGLPCSVGTLLNTLEGAELSALLTMLGTNENRGWSAADVRDTLRDEGYTVGFQTINRHRGRACRCFK